MAGGGRKRKFYGGGGPADDSYYSGADPPLLYGSFYLHDCAVMQGAACELAAVGSTLRTEPDREALMEQKRKKLLQGRLLGTGTAA